MNSPESKRFGGQSDSRPGGSGQGPPAQGTVPAAGPGDASQSGLGSEAEAFAATPLPGHCPRAQAKPVRGHSTAERSPWKRSRGGARESRGSSRGRPVGAAQRAEARALGARAWVRILRGHGRAEAPAKPLDLSARRPLLRLKKKKGYSFRK